MEATDRHRLLIITPPGVSQIAVKYYCCYYFYYYYYTTTTTTTTTNNNNNSKSFASRQAKGKAEYGGI
jgi:hypothetical protein